MQNGERGVMSQRALEGAEVVCVWGWGGGGR